jgi:hypothetical protein
MKKVEIKVVKVYKNYDYEMSGWNFKDTFKEIEGVNNLFSYNWSNLDSLWDIFSDLKYKYFEDYQNFEDFMKWYETFKEDVSDYFEYDLNAFNEFDEVLKNKEDYENLPQEINYNLDNIFNEIIESLIEDYQSRYTNTTIEALLDKAIEWGLIEDKFEDISTRGYNQGDYAEVLVDKKEYEKYIGVEFDYSKESKFIDQIFWDVPISFEAKIEYEIECPDCPIIYGVEEYFYDDFDELGYANYYDDYKEVEEAEKEVAKIAIDKFNEKFKTNIKYEDVKIKNIENY